MSDTGSPLTNRLIDSLYTEAMLLADETRSYFAGEGVAAREELVPAERVAFACEALKGTTRLMQVIGWLLTRRAIDAGELPDSDPRGPQRRLGEAPAFAPAVSLPAEAERLLAAGAELYDRVARLDAGLDLVAAPVSPARSLIERLERSL